MHDELRLLIQIEATCQQIKPSLSCQTRQPTACSWEPYFSDLFSPFFLTFFHFFRKEERERKKEIFTDGQKEQADNPLAVQNVKNPCIHHFFVELCFFPSQDHPPPDRPKLPSFFSPSPAPNFTLFSLSGVFSLHFGLGLRSWTPSK